MSTDAGSFPDDLLPTTGRFDGPLHHLPVRVYFEDTDASGVVYHARYLGFIERARTDMLRCIGITQHALMTADAQDMGVYAVRSLHIDYLRPAMLDDALLVTSRVVEVGAATCRIRQTVRRVNPAAGEIIVDATVLAAYLGPEGRPKRQPKTWVQQFRALALAAQTLDSAG